jgi:hypothetical protein
VAVTQWTYCVLRWIPLGHHKDSALKVRWIVQPGSAQFGGKACRTSDCRRLAGANFYSTSPDMFLGEEVEARFLPHRLQKYLPVPVGNSILLATDIESGDAPALCERSVA